MSETGRGRDGRRRDEANNQIVHEGFNQSEASVRSPLASLASDVPSDRG